MVKKSIKNEIKKPDIVMTSAQLAFTFVRTHVKIFVIALIICCLAAASVYAYGMYEERRSGKAQAAIAEGVKSLESFNRSGKAEDLNKAEEIFQKVVKEKPGKIYMVAELYLGTVYALKGRSEDARRIYQHLAKDGPAVVKMLSESALKNLDVK